MVPQVRRWIFFIIIFIYNHGLRCLFDWRNINVVNAQLFCLIQVSIGISLYFLSCWLFRVQAFKEVLSIVGERWTMLLLSENMNRKRFIMEPSLIACR
jgi:hypothetical protein